MKILQFIVLDDQAREGHNIFTVTGECFMSCGKPYPVIKRGTGCIGLGMVKSVLITQQSTEIEFNLTRDISKEQKKAYYDLYRNSVSADDQPSDPYENTDVVIPGAMMGNKKKPKRRHDDDDYDTDSLVGVARGFGYRP